FTRSAGCLEGEHFHSLPRDLKTRQAWIIIVYQKIPVKVDAQQLICSKHFTEDSCQNLGQFKAGFGKLLLLKRGAVPSVRPSQLQAGIELFLASRQLFL
uniref:THAP-type domain-containing protein n=1 Tax=Cyprinodon variegatus TaxID=28743 RepID=A0A3Q2DKV0_CYPVA